VFVCICVCMCVRLYVCARVGACVRTYVDVCAWGRATEPLAAKEMAEGGMPARCSGTPLPPQLERSLLLISP
jgi:hypothetical protein